MPIQQRIVLIGAGGLGVTAAWGLLEDCAALAGAELSIVDPDIVELSNLNRQVFFRAADIGKPKAEVLAERLREFTAADEFQLRLSPRVDRLEETSIEALLQGATLVIDACDSAPTKFLLNDYCVFERIALCYAGVIGLAGLALAIPANGGSACLRCVFGDLQPEELQAQFNSCREGGVVGAVAGHLGAIQAGLGRQLLAKELTASRFVRLTETLEHRQSDCKPDAGCVNGCGDSGRTKLDIRDKRCPSTFLYTKLALEQLEQGELLDVRIDSLETAASVTRSVSEEGHSVAAAPKQLSATHWRVVLRAGGAVPKGRDA